MTTKFNILLISDSYPPEVRSASRLMYEFATGMKNHGHDVTVLATYPQYNLAENNEAAFRTVEVENGIRVIRIKTLPIHLVGAIRRGIGILSLPLVFTKAAKKWVSGNVDIILVYSPPLPLAVAGHWLARYFNAKSVLNVQDLFPQNAIDLGVMTNPVLIRFFEMIERYAYAKADFITVHSKGNMQSLIEEKRVPPRKINVFHNWVNINEHVTDDRQQIIAFRDKYGLGDRFVVLFGGVIGPAQGLDVIVEAAEFLKGTRALFLILGDGTEKQRLADKVKNRGLDNVLLRPFVEPEEYERLLACVDAGLVTLSKKMKTPVVPGKLVSYMAQKKPVVASLNQESDGINLIREASCGFASMAGDGLQLGKNIQFLMESETLPHKMGNSGYEYVKQHMTKDQVLNQYEALFTSLQYVN